MDMEMKTIFSDQIEKLRKKRKSPGKKRQIRRMAGLFSGTGLRFLALFLCAALFAGFFPAGAAAEETQDDGQKVTAADLGEMETPEEFPAKGALCLQVARSKSIGADGGTSYLYEEAYLPVLVAQDHSVYGELETLSGLLGLNAQYFAGSVSVTFHETRLLLAQGDTAAGYTTPLYSVMVEMGRAPVILEGEWYVPLDAFLHLTGTLQKYGKANWMGKRQLNLIPPQRTVLDDIGVFYRDAYSRYAFSYVKDLGYTEEQAAELAGQTAVIRYINGVGSLDMRTWLAIAFGGYTEKALQQWEGQSAEKFMTDLLQENEEITAKMLEDSKKQLDYLGCMLDICMSVADSGKGAALAAQGTGAALAGADGVFTAPQLQKALSDTKTALASQGADTYAPQFARCVSAYQNAATALTHLYSLASLGLTFANADEKIVEAAELFYEKRTLLPERTVRDDQYAFVGRKIRQFDSFVSEAAVDQFIVDNGARLLLDAAAMAGYGAAKTAAGGSTLWSTAARVAGGKWIDAAESFQTGIFGMQYEADAIALARQELDRMLAKRTHFSLKEQEEEELRGLFFHAVKACIITRCYGCGGCPALMEKYPGLQQRQNAVNSELIALAARLNNPAIPFGRLPGELLYNGFSVQEHYKNVLYNFCAIQGQVLDWENELPAGNFRIEVMSPKGERLAEFVTDENGWFEEEFVLEEINAWEETPLVQLLTLHLYYKKNPVVLENVQINYFHRYEIEGLHVGRKTQESLVYVTGASVQDGQNVMDIVRIELDEDVFAFDAPDGYGGSYPAYAPLPGQMRLASDGESVLLEEGMEFQTLYGLIMPEDSLLRGLMDFVDAAGNIVPEGLMQATLSNAQEIQEFVDAYYEVNGQYPTFLLKTVNSLAVSAEPVAVVADESDVLH